MNDHDRDRGEIHALILRTSPAALKLCNFFFFFSFLKPIERSIERRSIPDKFPDFLMLKQKVIAAYDLTIMIEN